VGHIRRHWCDQCCAAFVAATHFVTHARMSGGMISRSQNAPGSQRAPAVSGSIYDFPETRQTLARLVLSGLLRGHAVLLCRHLAKSCFV
jgi:hypothetical protein